MVQEMCVAFLQFFPSPVRHQLIVVARRATVASVPLLVRVTPSVIRVKVSFVKEECAPWESVTVM